MGWLTLQESSAGHRQVFWQTTRQGFGGDDSHGSQQGLKPLVTVLRRSGEKVSRRTSKELGAAAMYHQLGRYLNILKTGTLELKHTSCMSALKCAM